MKSQFISPVFRRRQEGSNNYQKQLSQIGGVVHFDAYKSKIKYNPDEVIIKPQRAINTSFAIWSSHNATLHWGHEHGSGAGLRWLSYLRALIELDALISLININAPSQYHLFYSYRVKLECSLDILQWFDYLQTPKEVSLSTQFISQALGILGNYGVKLNLQLIMKKEKREKVLLNYYSECLPVSQEIERATDFINDDLVSLLLQYVLSAFQLSLKCIYFLHIFCLLSQSPIFHSELALLFIIFKQFMPLYAAHFFPIFNSQTFLKLKVMGSIETKIKEGYQLQMTPVFHSEVSRGHKPLQNLNQFFLHQQSGQSSQDTDLVGEEEVSRNHNPQTKKPHIKLTKILSTPHRYPYSTVGLIKSTIDGQETNGTGTIIGKRHVLTCAHNCYSIKENKTVDCLQFFPSYDPSKNRLSYQAKNIYISPSFQSSLQDGSSLEQAIANDYAVVELDTDEDLVDIYGSLGIDFSEKLSEREKQIIGYTKRHLRHSHLHCYKGEGHLEKGLIKYDMPASSGMGGSPIIEEREGQFYIIGLHVYYLKDGHQKLRGGLKMGRRVLENMEKWVQEEVQTIDLRQKCLQKEDLRYISMHHWKKLTHLTLVKCHLSSSSGKYLRKGNWDHLTHLDLGGNSLGKQGMQQFSQGDFRSLINLSLWGNNICKGGAYYLTHARLDSLQSLNLYHNDLCYDGVQNLCKGKWPLLIWLQLGNNSITFEATALFLDTCWTNIESLKLWGNGLEGEQSIIKSHLTSYYQRFKYLIT